MSEEYLNAFSRLYADGTPVDSIAFRVGFYLWRDTIQSVGRGILRDLPLPEDGS